MCVCLCVCDCAKWLQPFEHFTNTWSPFFQDYRWWWRGVCGGGGGALYVLLMPIVVHQQSLQLQLLTAASWGTEQSWPRKGCSLDGIWGLFVMFLFFYFPSLFVVLTVVVCAHAMKCMSSKLISIKGPMLSRK